MIRVEVTTEADVTRMVAAFQTVSALRDSDYEVWLVSGFGPGGGGAMRRAWRTDGMRGGSSQSNTTFISHGTGALGGFGGMVGAGGAGGSNVSVERHNHGPADPCPDDCPSLYYNPTGGPSWMERHNHRSSEPCGLMCPGNPSKPH